MWTGRQCDVKRAAWFNIRLKFIHFKELSGSLSLPPSASHPLSSPLPLNHRALLFTFSFSQLHMLSGNIVTVNLSHSGSQWAVSLPWQPADRDHTAWEALTSRSRGDEGGGRKAKERRRRSRRGKQEKRGDAGELRYGGRMCERKTSSERKNDRKERRRRVRCQVEHKPPDPAAQWRFRPLCQSQARLM